MGIYLGGDVNMIGATGVVTNYFWIVWLHRKHVLFMVDIVG